MNSLQIQTVLEYGLPDEVAYVDHDDVVSIADGVVEGREFPQLFVRTKGGRAFDLLQTLKVIYTAAMIVKVCLEIFDQYRRIPDDQGSLPAEKIVGQLLLTFRTLRAKLGRSPTESEMVAAVPTEIPVDERVRSVIHILTSQQP